MAYVLHTPENVTNKIDLIKQVKLSATSEHP